MHVAITQVRPSNQTDSQMTSNRKKSRHIRRLRSTRRGSIILELIIATPILVIALFVVVQFGLILANIKQVALASREAARIAAQSPGLAPGVPTTAVASTIRTEVNARLESAGFGSAASEGVTLRHTVAGGDVATDGTCGDPTSLPLPASAVRVTVCVELATLTPNLLSAFGYDILGSVVEHTTTLDYEP